MEFIIKGDYCKSFKEQQVAAAARKHALRQENEFFSHINFTYPQNLYYRDILYYSNQHGKSGSRLPGEP